MKEFFQPWRRKIGVVTLILACVLMGGWLRSLRAVNNIAFTIGDHSLIQMISRDEALAVRRIKSRLAVKELSVDRVLLMGFQAPQGNSTGHLATNVDPPTRAAEGSPFNWIMKLHGFEIGNCADKQLPLQIFVARVPYWSIVIPLTMASAYLLHGKTRVSIKSHGNVLPQSQVSGR
jgi:hypothetical protein